MADGTDPQNAPNDGATQQAAPAAQPATVQITPEIQALIDAAAQKAHDAGAAAARRALEGKQKQPEPQRPQQQAAQDATKPQPVSGMTADQVRSMLSFNRALGAEGLTAEAEQVLERLFEIESPAPSEIPGWVKSKAALFAKPNATAHAPTIPNNQAAQPGPKPQQPAAPAPLSTVPTDAPENVLQWDQTQLDAYIAKHYPVPSMPWHAKNAQARRVLSQKVHAAMAHVAIDLTNVRPR